MNATVAGMVCATPNFKEWLLGNRTGTRSWDYGDCCQTGWVYMHRALPKHPGAV